MRARRVLVVCLERVRERLDRRDERLLEPFVVARVRDRELRLVREAAEQAQLALAEVVGGKRGDDAADAAVHLDRRDRVRGAGLEWVAFDPRPFRRAEHEGAGVERQPRLPGVEAARLHARTLLRRVAVQLARREPAVGVLEPDRRPRRREQVGGQLDDALQDVVEGRGRGELPAELEQRRRALRVAPCRLVEARVLDRDRGVARRAPRAAARRPRRTGSSPSFETTITPTTREP